MKTYAPPFERFVAPARLRPAFWRLIVGLVLAIAIYVVWVAALFGIVFARSGATSLEAWAATAVSATTPDSLFLLFGSFFGMLIGPMIAARLLHKRPMGSVFGPAPATLRHFTVATIFALGFLALSVAGWSVLYDASPNLPFADWVVFLPFALLGLLIQTGAEEVLFRGYMQQQLAARFRSPLIWAFVPAISFGLVHLDPTVDSSTALLVVGAPSLFGLLAADLTAVTGSIGAAWGFHFANNAMAILILATDGTLTGLSLYLTPYSMEDVANQTLPLFLDLILMVLIWATLRRLLSR